MNLITFILRPLRSTNTLFLDRDGVLNHVLLRGSEISSPRSMEEFRIVDDIDALVDSDIIRDWNMVIVTNQPDISRNEIGIELLIAINDIIGDRIPINEVYICPHLKSDNCNCRKPKIGLIDAFRNNHPHLDGVECMVGDSTTDLNCAINANIPFILRKREYNSEVATVADHVVDDLYDIKEILSNINK